MCGSLRRENMDLKLGSPIEVLSPKGTRLGSYPWGGFARADSIERGIWNKHNPHEGVIKADSYNEKGVDFPVPSGKRIRCLVVNSPQEGEEGEKEIRIVTRPVTQQEIREAIRQGKPPHHRHPQLVDFPLR